MNTKKANSLTERGFINFDLILSEGDKVNIGALGSHVCLSTAVVVKVFPSKIEVETDSHLPVPTDCFEISDNIVKVEKSIRWYIEKCVYKSSMKSSRSSIRHLLLRSRNRNVHDPSNNLVDQRGHCEI